MNSDKLLRMEFELPSSDVLWLAKINWLHLAEGL